MGKFEWLTINGAAYRWKRRSQLAEPYFAARTRLRFCGSRLRFGGAGPKRDTRGVILPLLSSLSSARESGWTMREPSRPGFGEFMELTRARLGSSRNRLTARHSGASFEQTPDTDHE